MEQYYTVTSAKRLDGQDNYGNVTDSVFFEGEDDSALWKHAQSTNVAPGVKVYGVITTETARSGKTYRKFTKKMVPEEDFNANAGAETPNPINSTNAPQTSSKPFSGVSSAGDGARQGMATNLGGKYVIESAVRDNIDLSPQELADEIKRYAKEIYNIDLTVSVDDPVRDILL